VFFHNLKRFRRIATRYDKTASCYLAFLSLACTFLWV
jgi:transposase